MEIFEIKNLDCSKKENRKKLLKQFMIEFGLEEKPSNEKIGNISEKIEKKYNAILSLYLDKEKRKIQANIRMGDQYSTFLVYSIVEAYIKHCMIVKETIKNKKRKVK